MSHSSILIADDEELICRVLADTLREAGFTVETVATGDEAWRQLQTGAFALAFVDIRMPRLNGLDLLQHAQDAKLSTPVIIMTGQTTLTNAVEAIKRERLIISRSPLTLMRYAPSLLAHWRHGHWSLMQTSLSRQFTGVESRSLGTVPRCRRSTKSSAGSRKAMRPC